MGIFKDLLGTTGQFFRIGLAGPRLKNNSGNLDLRNAADSAYVDLIVNALQAAGINVTGNDIVLNSDGASGADRTFTLRRPSAGMTQNVAALTALPLDPASLPSPTTRNGREIFANFREGLAAPQCDADSTSARWRKQFSHAPSRLGNVEDDALPLFGYVVDELRSAGLPTSAVGDITIAVQFGFIAGTLVFAWLAIADRHSPRIVFFLSTLAGAAANAAKYLAGEAGFHACETAVMTHGGFGYAKEYHVERYLREVMIPRIAPISPQLALSFIAERVLGLPKSY